MKWFWGLILISVGVIVLGANFSWWNNAQIAELVNFWPLILVLLGVTLIFRQLRWGFVIILLAFLIALGFIFAALSGQDTFLTKTFRNQEQKTTPINVDLPSTATKATININTGAIKVRIRGGADKLVQGEMQSATLEPRVSTRTLGDEVITEISTDRITGRLKGQNTLDLAISDKVPVNLSINAGASSLDLDLSAIKTNHLDINAGASSLKLILGPSTQNNAVINIDAGASSLEIAIAQNFGVQIHTDTGLTSKNFIDYNQIDNQTYQSKNYESSTEKIVLMLKAGASSIRVKTL